MQIFIWLVIQFFISINIKIIYFQISTLSVLFFRNSFSQSLKFMTVFIIHFCLISNTFSSFPKSISILHMYYLFIASLTFYFTIVIYIYIYIYRLLSKNTVYIDILINKIITLIILKNKIHKSYFYIIHMFDDPPMYRDMFHRDKLQHNI